MTPEQFEKIMAFIIAAIGKPEKAISRATLEVYYGILKDLPHDAVVAAVKNLMANEEYPVLPTVGKIRKATINLLRGHIMTPPEAWGIVYRAIQYFGHYNEQRAIDSMPEDVAQVVGWMGWRELCHSDNIDVVRAQFMRMYETQGTRREQEALMPAEVREFLKGVGKLFELPGETTKRSTKHNKEVEVVDNSGQTDNREECINKVREMLGLE